MKKLLGFSIFLTITAACGSPEPASTTPASGEPPESGGTVVVGIVSDVQSWNPYLVEDLESEHVLSLLYPSLAVEQTDYHRHPPSFAPSLATSWTWSEDHLALTLELDPDAHWSDGAPITSRDVVFTWQVQTSPEVGWLYGYVKDFIEKVEAVDDHTVRATFTHVYPYQLMDLNDGPVIPAHAWSKIPFEAWGGADWKEQVLSGGPFSLSDHTPQQEITLTRNPWYFRSPLPRLGRLVFRISPSASGLLTQLLAGEIDFLQSVSPDQIGRVASRDDLEMVIYDNRSYTHICWKTDTGHLADPAVRTALTTAIDRQQIIDVVFNGFGRIAVGPVLSPFWAFNRNLLPLPYDPEAARAMLDEAGWTDTDGDGFVDRDGEALSIEILAPAENELRQDIALLVEADLEQVGVKVEPRFVEWGTLMAIMDSGEADAVVNMWEEPTQIDLEGLWHSPAPGEPTFNFGRYANPEVDELLAEVAELTDFADQKPLLDRIQALIVADQPYTFLVENTRITVHSSRIDGAEINAATPFFNIDEWTVDDAAGR
ncbi:MAG: ABC transporter substrate-binding protein [Thermoanaerobaculales bacterium]|jgi:peptide/nickel transport system substrate-binding protein|nr:ABC transporter substrate-binding protein [Thermoanaerobaculales bacterium]